MVTRWNITLLGFRVHISSILLGLGLLFFDAKEDMAANFDAQLEKVQSDTKVASSASKRIFHKGGRLLPVPIPVVNPTVGNGLAAALLYLHGSSEKSSEAPTTTTGVFGMYTDSKSWAVGGFHDGYYLNDRLRFRLPIAHGEFNLDFYGIGSDSSLKDNPIEYKAIGDAVIPRVLFELPWDDWFLGGQYRFLNVQTRFDLSDILQDDPGIEARVQTAGLGLVAVYDSRNSNTWPSKGNWLDLSFTRYGEYAGGDFDYWKTVGKWAQYFPVSSTITAVYRIDGQFVDGTAPFWDLSRIRLRGYSGGQLLDDVAVTGQAEVRWNFHERWTAVAFGGGGRIAGSVGDLGSSATNWAGGGGLRYMLVEKQKLSVGIEVAYAEDDTVSVYFQVGDWLAN